MNMTINPILFKQNPDKFLDAGAVIITADGYAEYQKYELQQSINRGLADIKAGRVRTHDEVFDKLLKKARNMSK